MNPMDKHSINNNEIISPIRWLNNQFKALPSHRTVELFYGSASSLSTVKPAYLNSIDSMAESLSIPTDKFSFRYYHDKYDYLIKIAISTLLSPEGKDGRNRFMIATTEDKSLIDVLNYMYKFDGRFDWISVSEDGIITEQLFIESVSPRSLMLSISLVNGVTGIIQPVEDIFKVCKSRNILIHIDITHAIGKGLDLSILADADFISFDAPPIHGIMGGGLFIQKQRIHALSMMFPDNDDLYANNILSLANALHETCHKSDYTCMTVAKNKLMFEKTILQQCDSSSLFSNNSKIPNVSLISFNNIHAEMLGFHMNHKKIVANFGCNNFQPISQILQATGTNPLQCFSSISFAFAYTNTKEEIEIASQLIVEIVNNLSAPSIINLNT